MEAGIQQIDGVESASNSFLTQKLTISAPEEQMERILQEAAKICRRIEPDCRILR